MTRSTGTSGLIFCGELLEFDFSGLFDEEDDCDKECDSCNADCDEKEKKE